MVTKNCGFLNFWEGFQKRKPQWTLCFAQRTLCALRLDQNDTLRTLRHSLRTLRLNALVKDLPRIEDLIWIEHLFDVAHKLKLMFRENNRHVFLLHHPNAVLAANGAAKFFT
jgi:hypothetical protein